MQYRTMPGMQESLSILGYGCMRFPRRNGGIDAARTQRQIVSAIEQGVNYFDTAYLYPGSERALGRILAPYRDKVYIATKLPVPIMKNPGDLERAFEKSLERLQTDHIDFYLIHNLISFQSWDAMKSIGVEDFIRREKQRGRIRHIGFSAHCNLQDFKRILDDFPWEFCQIQYNYLDQNYQAGTEGLKYAAQKNVGVVVMEPLRGGMLANHLPPQAQRIMESFPIRRAPAEWGLRWVWDHSPVQVVLSGMNEEAHIEANLRAAADALPSRFTPDETAMLERVRAVLLEKVRINCTGCAYCMPCPFGVDIPSCFTMLNDAAMTPGMKPLFYYALNSGKASLCKDCGKCEGKCPQHLPIRQKLREATRTLDKVWMRVPVRVYKAMLQPSQRRAGHE